MKTRSTVLLAVTLCLGLHATTTRANIIYSFSSDVDGSTEVCLTDGPGTSGAFETYFGTLTEKLYYNPAAGTLRHVGSLTLAPSSGSFEIYNFDFGENRGNATLTIGNNGVFSFDRTDTVYTYATGPSYSYGELQIPIHGVGTYMGQSFDAFWTLPIPIITEFVAVDRTSLTLSQYCLNGPHEYDAGEGKYIGLGELNTGTQDGVYYFSWTVDPIVARAVSQVPETASTLLLSGIGFLGLIGLKRWRLKAA